MHLLLLKIGNLMKQLSNLQAREFYALAGVQLCVHVVSCSALDALVLGIHFVEPCAHTLTTLFLFLAQKRPNFITGKPNTRNGHRLHIVHPPNTAASKLSPAELTCKFTLAAFYVK
eukprot:1140798-Pelagomonas_calceolata.AAC.1